MRDMDKITISDARCVIQIEPHWYVTRPGARQWKAEGSVELLRDTRPSEAHGSNDAVLSTSERINPCIVLTVTVIDIAVTGQDIVEMVNAAMATNDERVIYFPGVQPSKAKIVIKREYSNVTLITKERTTKLSDKSETEKEWQYTPLRFFWVGKVDTAAQPLTGLGNFRSGITPITLKLQGKSDVNSTQYDVIKEGLVVQATIAGQPLPLIQRIRTRSPVITEEDMAARALVHLTGPAAAVPFRKDQYQQIVSENAKLRAMNETLLEHNQRLEVELKELRKLLMTEGGAVRIQSQTVSYASNKRHQTDHPSTNEGAGRRSSSSLCDRTRALRL